MICVGLKCNYEDPDVEHGGRGQGRGDVTVEGLYGEMASVP